MDPIPPLDGDSREQIARHRKSHASSGGGFRCLRCHVVTTTDSCPLCKAADRLVRDGPLEELLVRVQAATDDVSAAIRPDPDDDLSLIRWTLGMTPDERLETMERNLRAIQELRGES